MIGMVHAPLPFPQNCREGGWGQPLTGRVIRRTIPAMPGMYFKGGESEKWCFKVSSRKELWEPSPSFEQNRKVTTYI